MSYSQTIFRPQYPAAVLKDLPCKTLQCGLFGAYKAANSGSRSNSGASAQVRRARTSGLHSGIRGSGGRARRRHGGRGARLTVTTQRLGGGSRATNSGGGATGSDGQAKGGEGCCGKGALRNGAVVGNSANGSGSSRSGSGNFGGGVGTCYVTTSALRSNCLCCSRGFLNAEGTNCRGGKANGRTWRVNTGSCNTCECTGCSTFCYARGSRSRTSFGFRSYRCGASEWSTRTSCHNFGGRATRSATFSSSPTCSNTPSHGG